MESSEPDGWVVLLADMTGFARYSATPNLLGTQAREPFGDSEARSAASRSCSHGPARRRRNGAATPGGMSAGDLAEDRAAHHRRGAGIDLVVKAGGFSGCIKAGNRTPVGVDDLPVAGRLHAAVGEAHAGNDRIGIEGRCRDRARPV